MQITLNLATRNYYNRRRFRMLMVLLCGLLLLLSVVGANRLMGHHNDRIRLTTEIADLDRQLTAPPGGIPAQEFSQHSRQVTILNSLLAQRQHSHRSLLDALEATLPNGIVYTHLVPDQRTKQVKLEGQARSLAVISELLERLGQADGFKDPTLLATDNLAQDSSPGTSGALRFTIAVGWNGL